MEFCPVFYFFFNAFNYFLNGGHGNTYQQKLQNYNTGSSIYNLTHFYSRETRRYHDTPNPKALRESIKKMFFFSNIESSKKLLIFMKFFQFKLRLLFVYLNPYNSYKKLFYVKRCKVLLCGFFNFVID